MRPAAFLLSLLLVPACEREVAEAPKPPEPTEPEAVVAVTSPEVSADELLEAAMEYRLVSGGADLTGNLRPLHGKKTPIGIYRRGKDWQLSWREGTGDPVRVHWQNGGLRRHRPDSDDWEKTTLDQEVAGTNFNVEDFAMPWFGWRRGEIISNDKILGRPCHVVQVRNPGEPSQFATVRFWISKTGRYPLQAVGYDASGGALKRYRVVDVQRVSGENRLRRLRMETVDPVRNEVDSMTYLEIDKPKRAWSLF